MSERTCSNSWPRVSTRSVVNAQYMNASSGSGLCPTRIRTRARTLATSTSRPRPNRRPRHAQTPRSRGSEPQGLLLTHWTGHTPSAIEEPALEQREDLLPGEGPRVNWQPVALEHADVVLERLVRSIERILELAALED